ncbi:MAG: hypothetical protein WKF73_12215 [Nocardioidaceae bacterium]
MDWSTRDAELLEFTSRLIALRTAHPVFRRRRFFTGDVEADGLPDVAWLRPDGQPMGDDDWHSSSVPALAVFLNGDAITEPGPRGEDIQDDTFLLRAQLRSGSGRLHAAGQSVRRELDSCARHGGAPCQPGSCGCRGGDG